MKRNKIVKSLLIVSVLVCGYGCASSEEKDPKDEIIGEWKKTSGNAFGKIIFFDSENYVTDSSNYEGHYSITDNQILFEGDLMSDVVVEYVLNDDSLELKGGRFGTYERVDEEE